MEFVDLDINDKARIKGMYSFNGIMFCLVDKAAEGKYLQATTFQECRDSIVSAAKSAIATPGSYGLYSQNGASVSVDRTRVAVFFKRSWHKNCWTKKTRNERIDRYIACSKKIVNFFERMSGLKRTVIYEAKVDVPDTSRFFVFEGSGEWMRAPAMLSLYLLLIRCGKFTEFEEFETFSDFMKITTKLNEERKEFRQLSFHERTYGDHRMSRWPFSSHDDIGYLIGFGDKIPVLMKNRRKIFTRKREDYFRNMSSFEGIQKFVQGDVGNKDQVAKFKSIYQDQEEMNAVAKMK
jgi:hypothetical protein